MRLRQHSSIIHSSDAALPPAGMQVDWLGHDENATAQTVYTFNMNFGATTADRVIIVAAGTSAGNANNITDVTVGGVTATAIVNTQSAATRHCTFWFALVPTGISGDVVVTVSSVSTRCSVDIWSIRNTTQTTYAARSGIESTNSTSASSLATPSITVPAGGHAFAMVWIGAPADTPVTWTQTSGTGNERTNEIIGPSAMWVSTYDTEATGAQVFTAAGSATAQYRIASIAWGP